MTEERKPWPQFSEAMRKKSEAFKRFKDTVLDDPDHWTKSMQNITFNPNPVATGEQLIAVVGKSLTFSEFQALGIDPIGKASPKQVYADDEIVGSLLRTGEHSFTIQYAEPT